jgi:hypothetical protein
VIQPAAARNSPFQKADATRARERGRRELDAGALPQGNEKSCRSSLIAF